MTNSRENNKMEYSVSSDTECTGLMPTPPASDAELEAYEELYPFLPAQIAGKNEETAK